MIRREILGPQDRFERSGAKQLRDVRSLGARIAEGLASQFSGLLLCTAAAAMVLAPVSVDLLVPASALYAAWVLTRHVVLPLRLPKSARCRDHNHPQPGKRRARMAEGIVYLGQDHRTDQELWLADDDARQHVAVPGTTGAGKTDALLSLVSNALTQESGFIFVDGKADNKLYAKAHALARRFGREDDLLVLNFLVASGAKHSNTFNPFAIGNADTIRELLVSQIEANPQGGGDSNKVFMDRAVGLMGALTPALVWMRDHKDVPIDIEKIRFATELQSIVALALEKKYRRLHVDNGRVEILPVPDIPEALLYPLKAYLGETGGFDPDLPYNKQKTDEPAKQHSFVTMHFSKTFTQLAVSLGHIFKCESGDIDMRDVVLNRRILVVNLPSLENSGETTAALGKIVVASLRNMMAQTLGADLEGDYSRIVANTAAFAPSPYPVVFDEVGYYVSPGMDKMIAQGRSLGFMFYLGFQEVASLRARIGESFFALVGNANLTVAMRQQDAHHTRQWLEETAGQAPVAQATSYQGDGGGSYRETQHAEIRQVSRIDWNDLQRLIEGEAIILFGGRRIYAKLFHVAIEVDGPMRLNRPLMLPASKPSGMGPHERVRQIVLALRAPLPNKLPDEARSATLDAMVAAMAAAGGGEVDACLDAALDAAGETPWFETPDNQDPARPINTEFTPMLAAALDPHGSAVDAGVPADPVDERLYNDLVEIEQSRGLAKGPARAAALATLAERDAALRPRAIPDPPPMAAEVLCRLIVRLTTLLPKAPQSETAEKEIEYA